MAHTPILARRQVTIREYEENPVDQRGYNEWKRGMIADHIGVEQSLTDLDNWARKQTEKDAVTILTVCRQCGYANPGACDNPACTADKDAAQIALIQQCREEQRKRDAYVKAHRGIDYGKSFRRSK